MANNNINDEWQEVKREHGVSRFSPTVNIRPNGTIAIGVDFIRMADIDSCTHANLYLSSDGLRLGIKFHNNRNDDNAYILGKDGGGNKNYKSRIIVAVKLFKQSNTLRALLKENSNARTYTPVKNSDKWIINLAPCFESVIGQKDFPRESTGIYRYRFKEEIIYIGKGNITQRLSSSERKEWKYDRIEYSILNDDLNEIKWETYWLNEYREKNGRWPMYNRISGMRERESKIG